MGGAYGIPDRKLGLKSGSAASEYLKFEFLQLIYLNAAGAIPESYIPYGKLASKCPVNLIQTTEILTKRYL